MQKTKNGYDEMKYIRDILVDMTAETKTFRELFANTKIEISKLSTTLEGLQDSIHIFSQDHDIIINIDTRLKETEKDDENTKTKLNNLDNDLNKSINDLKVEMGKHGVYVGIVATIVASVIGIVISNMLK